MNNMTIKILKVISGNVMLGLSGKHNATTRQFIMSDIMNKKIPKSKCGVTVLFIELLKFANFKTLGACLAEKLDFLAEWTHNLELSGE